MKKSVRLYVSSMYFGIWWWYTSSGYSRLLFFCSPCLSRRNYDSRPPIGVGCTDPKATTWCSYLEFFAARKKTYAGLVDLLISRPLSRPFETSRPTKLLIYAESSRNMSQLRVISMRWSLRSFNSSWANCIRFSINAWLIRLE